MIAQIGKVASSAAGRRADKGPPSPINVPGMDVSEVTGEPVLHRTWRWYVREVARDADFDSAHHLQEVGHERANVQMVVVLVVTALSLTLINFYAKRYGWVPGFASVFGADTDRVASAVTGSQLTRLAIWTGVQVIAYVALPAVALGVAFRRPITEFGLRVRGIGAHWKIYAILLAVSVPFVVLASFDVGFQEKYPFYTLAPGESLWPAMAAWWTMYAIQFVALEFFFRGFMVHGLKGRLGYAAIFVMIVPYNMIHYQKPLLEAIGAIIGGYVLGTLSLKTRSIWWGASLHIAVAATMDGLALYHKGIL